MYDTAFFRTKLGHASLASIAAMTAMIALSTQVSITSEEANLAQPNSDRAMLVELA